NGRLDVARGGIDVAIKIELKSDAGGAESTGRGHLSDAGNAPELTFEWSSDCRGHCFRACPRQVGSDGDSWKIDLRKRRNRQEPEGHDTREKDSESHERCRDGSTD